MNDEDRREGRIISAIEKVDGRVSGVHERVNTLDKKWDGKFDTLTQAVGETQTDVAVLKTKQEASAELERRSWWQRLLLPFVGGGAAGGGVGEAVRRFFGT